MPLSARAFFRPSSPWISGALTAIASFATLTAVGCYRDRLVGAQAFFFPPNQAANVIFSIFAGVLVGAFFSERAKPYRKYFWYLVLLFLVISGINANPPWSYFTWFLAAAIVTWRLLRVAAAKRGGAEPKPTTFGSAEWADLAHIQRIRNESILGSEGLFLGLFEGEGQRVPLYYKGQRHLLTVAPTRAGKGTTAIIPNLLSYQGSALVIDPKGENATITALRRGAGDPGHNIPGLGQDVHVVDPWGITGLPVSRFNPMDWLDPSDPDIEENAMMLADSLVVARSGGNSEFFDAESKALLLGFLLYVAIDETEEGDRTLGRVRDLIVLGPTELREQLEKMSTSPNPVVRSTAARHAGKDPELAANVMSSLQSHTHILDSPRIRASLSHSDFRFQDMKHSPLTVYLVLPADRLDAFGRWLRLLVQQAITMNARNIEAEPKYPILFLLDEMAALGKLTMVEQAFGLMAGFGMQLWGIVQDVSQLERTYGTGWETFVGNSGVLQYLGSRDQKTAEYFSKLCGVSTIVKTSFSRSIARAFGQGGGSTTHSDSTNTDHIQRHLAFPDELMVFRKEQVLLLIENYNPINGKRVRWFEDPQLKALGVDLKAHPRISA